MLAVAGTEKSSIGGWGRQARLAGWLAAWRGPLLGAGGGSRRQGVGVVTRGLGSRVRVLGGLWGIEVSIDRLIAKARRVLDVVQNSRVISDSKSIS